MLNLNLKNAIVGIDPGLDGGLAMFPLGSDGSVEEAVAVPMPTKPAAKGRDVDGKALAHWLDEAYETHKVTIRAAVLEVVHAMPKQGVVSVFNFGKGYGRVLGVLECLEIPLYEVTPQRWKKLVLDGLGREKADSIRYVMNHFPKLNLMATSRSKVPHDGMAEAVCLAEYGRRQFLGELRELVPSKHPHDEQDIVEEIDMEVVPQIQASIMHDGVEKDWLLHYTRLKGKPNTLKLEAGTRNEAIAEAAKFLQIPDNCIRVE